MTYGLIIGNILSFISILFLIVSVLKNKKQEIVFYQIFDCLFDALANFILGGLSGAVVILGSLLRNILVYTNKINNVIIWLIMAMMVVCGLWVNQHGWIGILPIVANLSYTLWLCYGGQRAKSVKIVLAVNMLIWAVYDFTILAIPAVISDGVILAVTLYGLYRSYKFETNATND